MISYFNSRGTSQRASHYKKISCKVHITKEFNKASKDPMASRIMDPNPDCHHSYRNHDNLLRKRLILFDRMVQRNHDQELFHHYREKYRILGASFWGRIEPATNRNVDLHFYKNGFFALRGFCSPTFLYGEKRDGRQSPGCPIFPVPYIETRHCRSLPRGCLVCR